MDFTLSDEQRLLGDSARRFGEHAYPFPAWRAKAAVAGPGERWRWTEMAELGWPALGVAEDDGGLGGSPVDVMVLMEAFGRFLMLEPYVPAAVLAPILLAEAKPELRTRLTAGLIEGSEVIALADAEPAGRFDPAWVETRAVRAGDGFVLHGRKSHVLDGGSASGFVVPARTSGEAGDERGISLVFVPAAATGLTVRPSRAMDFRHNAALELDRVQVAQDALLGEPDCGLPLLRRALDHGIAARLAEALGAMDALHDTTLEYLKTRRQFGQPLGAFQVLQHRAVDMAIACEEARSMTYLATLSLEQPERERRRAISAAKARMGQLSLAVARQAVQLHGGVGFSDELAVGHYLKRLTMIDMCFGNADHHRGLVREALRRADAA